ncbi:iron-containing alcohol dehydrogenase, partial [Bacteroides thetaiotaomicron]
VDIAARSLFTRAGEPWLARGVDLAIDHHPSQAFFAAQTCLDAGRAACGELIYDILRELGPITPAMAIPLYVAVSTDTGCFQYSNTTADTHRVAAALMDTGIDVFTHAVEAFVSTEASDFSDAAAEKAIKLVKRHLLPAYQNPEDRKARQGMHNASCLAGIAFSNSGLGLNHGMAHALGARFHIPHGRANGILLPYVMSFNAGCAEQLTSTAKRYARISRLLELESSSVRQSALNLIRTARRYIEKLNMPSTLQAAGVNAAEFEEAVHDMAEAALADRCTATNPRSCTAEEIEQIFRKAYSGKLP